MSDPLTGKMRRATRIMILLASLVSLFACAVWLNGQTVSVGWDPRVYPVAIVVLINSLVLCFSLFIYTLESPRPWLPHLARAALVLVALSGAGAPVLYSLAVPGGQPQLPFEWMGRSVDIDAPASAATVIYTLSLLALLNGEKRTWALRGIVFSAMLVLTAGSLVVFIYQFGLPFIATGDVIPPSYFAGLALTCLSSGILFAVTTRVRFLRDLHGPSIVARMLRAFVPAVGLIIIGEALLEYFVLPQIRHAERGLGMWVISAATVVVTTLIVFYNARRLRRELDAAEQLARRSEEAIKRKSRDLALLNDIARDITSSLNSEEVLYRTVQAIYQQFNYHHVAIFTASPEHVDEMIMRASAGRYTNVFPVHFVVKVDRGMVGWSASTKQPLLSNDISTEPRYINRFPGIIHTQSELCIPILLAGKLMGVLDLQSPRLTAFEASDLSLMETLAGQIAIALENARLYQEMQKDLEERIQAEEKFRSLIEQTSDNVCMLDEQGRIIEWNPGSEKNTGLTRGEVLGQYFWDIQTRLMSEERRTPEHLAYIKDTLMQALRTGVSPIFERPIEATLKIPSIGTRHIQQVSFPIKTLNGFRIGFVTRDITERRKFEIALQESEAHYRELFETSTEGLVLSDLEGNVIDANPAFLKILGYDNLEDIRGRSYQEFSPVEYYEIEHEMITTQPLVRGYSDEFEKEYFRKTGERVPVSIRAWLRRNSQGQPAGFWLTIRDITLHRQKDERLRAMLLEKEVLLREIHHRVKNNLQIINSLLSLRAESIQDEQALQAFQDVQNNVRAIALIHENLYRSENLAQIDANDYISSLIHHLRAAFGRAANQIILRIEVSPISLNLDSAIPCGLIVTELFTNALKHAFPAGAFPAGKEPNIWIRLCDEDTAYRLEVIDNGVGLPEQLDPGRPKTLGLQLIRLLSQQLHGSLEITGQAGASFILRFPKPERNEETNRDRV